LRADSVRSDDQNFLFERRGHVDALCGAGGVATVSYTGTFTGTSTVHGSSIFHSDGTGAQFPPWRANFHDVETFTGTVNGVPGTVTFNLNGSNDPTGAVKGTATIVSATDDLAGLHGVLSEVGTVPAPSGPVGTYTGQFEFGSP
jgi:hypothetical protein